MLLAVLVYRERLFKVVTHWNNPGVLLLVCRLLHCWTNTQEGYLCETVYCHWVNMSCPYASDQLAVLILMRQSIISPVLIYLYYLSIIWCTCCILQINKNTTLNTGCACDICVLCISNAHWRTPGSQNFQGPPLWLASLSYMVLATTILDAPEMYCFVFYVIQMNWQHRCGCVAGTCLLPDTLLKIKTAMFMSMPISDIYTDSHWYSRQNIDYCFHYVKRQNLQIFHD